MFGSTKIAESFEPYARAITNALYTVAGIALMILLALVTR